MSVLLILLSAMTWVPQFSCSFSSHTSKASAGSSITSGSPSAIFIASVVWILLLALLSQAISALVKWRVVASGALLGLFFIPSVFGEVVNNLFLTRWGNIISLGALMKNVTAGLFGTFVRSTGSVVDFGRPRRARDHLE